MYPQKLIHVMNIIPMCDLEMELGDIVKKAMFDMSYGPLRAQGEILYISDIIRSTPGINKIKAIEILHAIH